MSVFFFNEIDVMKTVASSKTFSSSLFYLQLLLLVTHYVDSQPTNVLIIKSEKQQTRYNELVNTHQGYPVTLFYACTPCFFTDKMQVEQKFLSYCSEPPRALLKCSVCLGRAGVHDSAFVPVKVWLDQSGDSRLRRGGAEDQDGVQHLPTTPQPCCLQAGGGELHSLHRRPPYTSSISSSVIWTLLSFLQNQPQPKRAGTRPLFW